MIIPTIKHLNTKYQESFMKESCEFGTYISYKLIPKQLLNFLAVLASMHNPSICAILIRHNIVQFKQRCKHK